MAATWSQVYAEAKKHVGVKESPANSNNVIFNTEYYGKAVRGSAYPWCCVFLWYVFKHANASDLFYGGNKCAYTPTLANYYKNKKQWYTTPKVGDIVFYQFSGSNRINHVGIVIEVLASNKIKTIEGNTSSSNDANGGAVEIRTRTTKYVKGYGRPSYKAESNKSSTDTKYTKTQFIKDLQAAIGVKVTGTANAETLDKTPTLSKTKNNRHKAVFPVQKYLNALGCNCGTPDGDFGSATDAGVKKFQTWMKKPDGELTAKGNTWKKLLGL